MLPDNFFFFSKWISSVSNRELKVAKYSPENSATKWGQSLQKLQTVKSQLIVQFDKFNGQASVTISWGYSLVKSTLGCCAHVTVNHVCLCLQFKFQSPDAIVHCP